MRRMTIFAAALAVAAVAVAANPALGSPAAARGGYDIGRLMSEAESSWDLSGLDAVILVDSESVAIDADGTRTTTVHRVVWMATAYALELYGDLRVPWNSATSTLDVKTLRSWRDGRWWPHESELSETAVVPTISYGLQSADDYATMRETMLLHDGIELPCIVETVYEITERRPEGLGADGVWVFSRHDPAVVSRFELSVPAGTEIRFAMAKGAPDPSEYRTASHGVGHAWEMRTVDRRGWPLVDDPTSDEPCVAWSTWADWAALGSAIGASIDEKATLSEALRDSVAKLTRREPTLWSKLEAVAEFIEETTRAIHYAGEFWEFSPRPASRTWETAYGHRLDRAVLATALFREAGCSVLPAFRGRGYRDIDESVPSLARFDGVYLWIEGGGVEACYDPEYGILAHGRSSFAGRATWMPAKWDEPRTEFGSGRSDGALSVDMTLEAAEEGWAGTGFLSAAGRLSPYGAMTGLSGETESHLADVASSVLPGSDVSEIGILALDEDDVAAGFAFTVDMGEPDELGRTRIEIGDPDGGVADALPGDVHAYGATRSSPVLLPCPMSETVTVRIRPGDLEVVRLPDNQLLENATGRFALTVTEDDDGWIEISRELAISTSTIPAARWSELRSLLLAHAHERNRTILLE